MKAEIYLGMVRQLNHDGYTVKQAERSNRIRHNLINASNTLMAVRACFRLATMDHEDQ